MSTVGCTFCFGKGVMNTDYLHSLMPVPDNGPVGKVLCPHCHPDRWVAYYEWAKGQPGRDDCTCGGR